MVIKSDKTRVAAAKVSYSAVTVRNYSVFDICIGAQKMDFSLVSSYKVLVLVLFECLNI